MSRFGRFTEMPRDEIQQYLEGRGYAVYASESVDELREAASLDEKDIEASDLLLELKAEREKYTECDEARMRELIEKLQELGEYPKETQDGNPNDVWGMVSGWGAYWHRWSGQLNCSNCDADFRDLESGPPFMRQIGISDGDSIHSWECPDCNHKRPRG